ncbi:MAG: flagellar motor switch phosphatase FliY [Candidatus Abyssubacteria bacterium]
MTDETEQIQETGGAHNRELASVLAKILDSASVSFPVEEDFIIGFSVALVGEMGREELPKLIAEYPVVAEIDLHSELGDKAMLLLDVPTATALANLGRTGQPAAKASMDEQDIESLHDALLPLIDAFSSACEDATGRPFGSIREIKTSDRLMQQRLATQLPERLSRAAVSLSIGTEPAGRLMIVLPSILAEMLSETQKTASANPHVTPYEQVELQEGITEVYSEQRKRREPSMENIDLILDIQLELTARLGQVEMPLGEIMKLAPGSVIDIDRFVDEPVELVVNNRLIAKGEIVVVQENFGIKITEIISPKERIKSLK